MKLKGIITFQLVALMGMIVNLSTIWVLHGVLNISVPIAGACAIELAIIHNFIWHYFLTWRERVERNLGDFFTRLMKYNLITASIDFIVNLGILWALTKFLDVHYILADIVGMIGGPVLKFLSNEFIIFRKRPESF